jgi:CBS domain-containing protein
MRPPLTPVEQAGHVAAAAYLMKHAGATALMVLDVQTGQPIGITTQADIARAVADGKPPSVRDQRSESVTAVATLGGKP